MRRCLLVSLCLPLFACDAGRDSAAAVGQLAWDRIEVIAEAAEPLVELSVREGDPVQAGQVIAQLDPARARTRLDQAAAERQRLEAALTDVRRGPRAERVAQAQAALTGAQSSLKTAEAELDRVQQLIARGLMSAAALDQARTARDRARAEHDAAAERLDELRRGATSEEQAQAEAALARARAAEQEAALALERLTLRAPRAGRVDALPYLVGDRPPAGGTVAVLLVGTAPYARVYVAEGQRVQVRPGTRATVNVDGLEQPLSGRVRAIASEPTFTPFFALTERDRARLTYLAEVALDAAPEGLPAGVPVQVRFQIDTP